jgi:glycosyltransferase involved in cell wall biosynthesis
MESGVIISGRIVLLFGVRSRYRLAVVVLSGAPKLSIVIPVYNEVESLDELVRSVESAMASMGAGYEIVFVDDGSTDGSFQKLKSLAEARSEIRLFSFRRNLGKSPALTCGFQKARGEFIATLDADLQDDPRDIAMMYAHLLREDADVVSGWRKHRQDSALKVAASKLFNLLVIRTTFGVSYRDMNSGCKLYRADAARALALYGGMHRFIPLILSGMGYRVVEVPVTHHRRKHGVSKYSSTKLITASPDLLTIFFLMKYTGRPLHFFGRLGAALFVAGFVMLLYLTYLWLQSIPIGTRPLLNLGVLLVLIGFQIVLTGLLADLILKVNYDARREFPVRYESPGALAPKPAGADPLDPHAFTRSSQS